MTTGASPPVAMAVAPGSATGSGRRSHRPGPPCRRRARTGSPRPCSSRRRLGGATSSTRVSLAVRENRLAALACRPGAITPPRNSPFALTTSKFVAVPKSTTIAGPPVIEKAARAFTTRSAPTSRGLSVSTRNARLDPGTDDHRGEGEVLGRHLTDRRGHVGHDARDHEAREARTRTSCRAAAGQPRERQGEFVGGALGVGRQAPRVLELGAAEHAEDDLGVADIGGEQHGSAIPLPRGCER